MQAKDSSAHPVETLRSQSKTLEETLAACISNPSPAVVHRLRTTIRRVEAQTRLLAQLPGLPRYRKESRKLQKHLKKLRRLAGKVRDLDVQLDLTTKQSSPETVAEAASLRRRLKHQRIERIAILIETVRRHHEKISLATERLLMALRPVERMKLPASELIALTQRWYARRYNAPVSRDELHATRKAAKLARYMLESAPNSVLAKRTAKKFEEIQHRGGQWHDWLQLAAAAASTLGKEHPLTELYNQKRNSHFGGYRKTLAEQHRYLCDSKKA